MRALIQRVKRGSVSIDGRLKGEIGSGYVLLLGVGREDGEDDIAYLVRKTVNLRIFADGDGKINLSLRDTGGQMLIISQFTLYADTSRGNRPGFEPAAPPEQAARLYERFVAAMRAEGVPVQTGEFGADMTVEIINDGPVTIMLDSRAR
ncbi:MAG: D-aminoacyl-tRNA deacylase [Bacillota bacterium]|nr:D-aminoacyl-tRNA deacylase [Bacillota bacterium]